MELIRPFSKLNKKDVAIASGKGASLGEMTRAGIPVPPGFVILSTAFERFLKETGLHAKIDSILESADHKKIHTIENASGKIQALILSAKIPADIASEIKANFKKLGAKFVAVRSSATAEDGSVEAWAGQLDSFLNTNKDLLLKNTKRCWASLFTPRAIFYRFEKNLHEKHISVAVVIQKMIRSETSGVAFSVHPVTQDKNRLIIEAGFGLGEAIVSGQITPDSYVVEKEPLRIIDKKIIAQERGLFRAKSGGNKWKKIPVASGKKQVLPDKEIFELSALIVRIERHYGIPCDIEWAGEKGRFYIIQSRPITALTAKKPQEYRKIMNRSMFLMACEIWDKAERVGLPKICERAIFFDPLLAHSPGKGITIYYNFTDERQNPALAASYFNKHEKLLDKLKIKFDKYCDKARKLIAEKDPKKFKELFDTLGEIWPLVALSNVLGDEREEDFGVKKSLIPKYRGMMLKETEGLLHWGVETLLEEAEKLVPRSHKKHAEFLLASEILSRRLPSKKELDERKKGYIYYNGRLYTETLENFARKNNFLIVDGEASLMGSEVKGSTAFPGKARGRVKIVLERQDIGKVRKGDILVTSMTTPNLIAAMEKAAAFVTDEGGVTCHAAITAREMKKPCVIGTKVATKVLKDGDRIEVNASKGTVKILK